MSTPQQPQHPQYAPPPVPQSPVAAQPPQASLPPGLAPHPARTNTLGIVALILVLCSALLSGLTPLIYRALFSTMRSIDVAAATLQALHGALLLTALGLAIAGVLSVRATRMRWTAIGALVSASVSIFIMLLSLLVNVLASAIPY